MMLVRPRDEGAKQSSATAAGVVHELEELEAERHSLTCPDAAAAKGGASGLLVSYDSIFLAHVTKLAASDVLFA